MRRRRRRRRRARTGAALPIRARRADCASDDAETQQPSEEFLARLLRLCVIGHMSRTEAVPRTDTPSSQPVRAAVPSTGPLCLDAVRAAVQCGPPDMLLVHMYRQCIRHSLLTKTAMHTACAVYSAVYQTQLDTQHYVLPDKWQCTQPFIQCYIMAHCIDSKITPGIANALSRKSVYSSLHYVLAYVDSSFCFIVILSELLDIHGESLHTKSNR